MDKNILSFSNAPWGYELCFNNECSRHELCMHYHMGQLAPECLTKGSAIYPSAWKNGDCRHFAPLRKVQFAWGFNGLYRHMSYETRKKARMSLRAHLGAGVSAYYRIHNGEKLLSPARQQEILDFMAQFGNKEDMSFDHYVTQYDFTT